MRSIRNKILVVAVASVAVATLAMLVVLFVGKRRVGKTLRMEVSRSSKSETGKLARAVRLMAQAADRILHKELRAAADGVAAHLSTVLAPKQILLPEGTQRTQLTDLSSQQRGLVELTARETDTKIIIYRAVGGAAARVSQQRQAALLERRAGWHDAPCDCGQGQDVCRPRGPCGSLLFRSSSSRVRR